MTVPELRLNVLAQVKHYQLKNEAVSYEIRVIIVAYCDVTYPLRLACI